MGVVDDKLAVFDQVVLLRRAESQAPGVREIPIVRAQLERRMGSSVSLMMAARILGVSQTTVDRWSRCGDLPVVVSNSGRREIPVGALAELYERVEVERSAGRSHVLEPVVREWRDAAAAMDIESVAGGDADAHARGATRSLVYHRAGRAQAHTGACRRCTAAHLGVGEPGGSIDPQYANAWEHLLDGTVREVGARVRADTPRMADLRQNSPFAGVLSEPERRRILDHVR